MNLRLISLLVALGSATLASCYPYNENDRRRDPRNRNERTVSNPEQQKIQDQRDRLKRKETAMKKQRQELTERADGENERTIPTTPPIEKPKPKVPEKRDNVVAQKVPGKEGFVFSPYNNKVINVQDIPSGTLVQDPTYTGDGTGYFRVP